MLPKKITDFLIYRWRYRLGYVVMCLLSLLALTVALAIAQTGLTSSEMQSAVASSSLSFTNINPQLIIDLPYHVLQATSMKLFGLSIISVKLVSYVLSIFIIIGVFSLLRYWFRRNVAIITTIIVVTTGQFLFIAQNGTPSIMLMLWPTWILFSALMVSRNNRFTVLWKVVMVGAAALSLYTPLSIYILLAMCTAIAFHPHLRYLVRTMIAWKVIVAGLFGIGLLVPLGFEISKDPHLLTSLLGIPDHSIPIIANSIDVAKRYVDFIHPSSATYMTPIYGLTTILIVLLGIYGLITTKYTARNYITSIWLVLLIPIIICNPDDINAFFLPIVLLIATGLNLLFRSWYSLFPHNPYARSAGLIPLTILIGALVFSGVNRYAYGYLYNPEVSRDFNKDITLIDTQLAELGSQPVTLITKQASVPFYSILIKKHPNLTVTSSTPETIREATLIGHGMQIPSIAPARIITSDTKNDADRLYVYKF